MTAPPPPPPPPPPPTRFSFDHPVEPSYDLHQVPEGYGGAYRPIERTSIEEPVSPIPSNDPFASEGADDPQIHHQPNRTHSFYGASLEIDNREPQQPYYDHFPGSNTVSTDSTSHHDLRSQQRQPHHSGEDPSVGYSNLPRTPSSTTPGADNLGDNAAGGGIAGIALGVAATNERQSGMQALRAIENGGRAGPPGPPGRAPMTNASRMSYTERQTQPQPQLEGRGDPYRAPPSRGGRMELHEQPSYSSTIPLAAAAAAANGGPYNSEISLGSYPSQDRYSNPPSRSQFPDHAYNRFSATWDPRIEPATAGFNPNDIEDDGDDGLAPSEAQRRSVLSFGRQSSSGVLPGSSRAGTAGSGAAAATGAAAAGGVMGTLGRWASRSGKHGSNTSGPNGAGQYGPVPGGGGGGASGSGSGGNGFGSGSDLVVEEKSEWLNRQHRGTRKLKWLVGIVIVILLAGAIAGGIVGGVLGSRRGNDGSTSGSRSSDSKKDKDGDLTKDSPEIKALMGNPNLHKVFPGMDYTPLGAQYPDCLKNPPSQNDVTQDVAVLSQLTNRIRLYGTDCNQTEMVLHSIDVLDLKQDAKVWLGVWQDRNKTTNARQLEQMYSILDKHGAEPFAGVIVGNEVLYKQDMSETQLAQMLLDVRSNLTAKAIKLPVTTSDLGDNWHPQLASAADIVMANIHPFFSGTEVDKAAGWAWSFWQEHNVLPTATLPNRPKQVMGEVGWPSGGGNHCGAVACTDTTSHSVAGIAQMNEFMDTFVCQSLANGTEFFWFEAFDEPWKGPLFNEPGKEWEDKWGLMDAKRKLKTGVKIPDCGGKTIPS
ncbi:MAG: hypothetical protein M1816_007991 [Peltula sp. TS41687]|nr:MAG: hypothetical protein M1816_007991 [Peltula sp. TS41687]